MGFFDKPIVTCGICKKEIGKRDKRWKTKDGHICAVCQEPFGIWSGPRAFVDKTSEELKIMQRNQIQVRKFWANNKEMYDTLHPNRNVAGILIIDDEKKKWYIKTPPEKGIIYLDENAKYPPVFDFSDIVGVSVSLGDKTITSTAVTRKDKGLRKAAVGGILAGAPGAVIGSILSQGNTTMQTIENQSYYVNITIEGAEEPIPILVQNEQTARELHDTFLSFTSAVNAEEPNRTNQVQSNADELRKFKSLFDDGIISQEEFDAKKKQLLGL